MSDMRERAAKWLEDNKSYYDGVKVGSLAAEFQRIRNEAVEDAARVVGRFHAERGVTHGGDTSTLATSLRALKSGGGK